MDPLLSCKHLRGCLSFHLHLQVPTFPYCRVENFFYFNSLGAVFWGDKEGHFFASTLTHPSDPKGLCPSSLRLAPCHQDVQDVFSSTLVLKPFFFSWGVGTKPALLPLKHIPGKQNEINSEPVPAAWCSQPENLELLQAETALEPQTMWSHWQVIG